MSDLKILIVDDSLFFREALARGLASNISGTIEVEKAENPFEARDKILSFDPETGKHFCVEIEDVSNVDKRRAEIGLPSVRVFCKKYNITPPANY